jgi:hypothetical protein
MSIYWEAVKFRSGEIKSKLVSYDKGFDEAMCVYFKARKLDQFELKIPQNLSWAAFRIYLHS